MIEKARLRWQRDVVLIEPGELAADVRARFEHAPGDLVVSRRRSRAPSVVVDESAAAVVRELASPTTIVDAVLRAAKKRGVDPKALLREVVPLVRRLAEARMLVEDREDADDDGALALEAGDRVREHEVIGVASALEDVEVHQIQLLDGGFGAIKIARRGPSLERARVELEREAAALARLDGAPAPRLLEHGELDGAPFVIAEWVRGAPAHLATIEARETGDRVLLLRVLTNVARAYATLHERGVLHGDVHPGNVLVDARGDARLVDFGLAVLPDRAPPARAGVVAFFEPELARAIRNGAAAPASSERGEQHAVAALLHRIATGADAQRLSLERREALRQIDEDPPLSFEALGLDPWPDVEHVLTRALAKDPGSRFASMRELARALEGASISARRAPIAARRSRLDALAARTLKRASPGGELFERGFEGAPTASVNLGAAGLAYALYRVACVRHDARALALADEWIARAQRDAATSATGLRGLADVGDDEVGARSTHHREPGLHAVEALIAAARGDRVGARRAGRRFEEAARVPDDRLDLVLGTSGVILAAAALAEPHVAALPIERTRALALRVEDFLAAPETIRDTSMRHAGIAHGWAGLLAATLRFRTVDGASPSEAWRRRFAELGALVEPHGRGTRVPRELGRTRSRPLDDTMPGFCGGSAGMALLFVEAARATADTRALDVASSLALHAYDHGDRHGDLCCGLTGRAYAMLALYRATGDRVWLDRARRLGELGAEAIAERCSRRDSLYRGETGATVLAVDLERPGQAFFPFFGRDEGEHV